MPEQVYPGNGEQLGRIETSPAHVAVVPDALLGKDGFPLVAAVGVHPPIAVRAEARGAYTSGDMQPEVQQVTGSREEVTEPGFTFDRAELNRISLPILDLSPLNVDQGEFMDLYQFMVATRNDKSLREERSERFASVNHTTASAVTTQFHLTNNEINAGSYNPSLEAIQAENEKIAARQAAESEQIAETEPRIRRAFSRLGSLAVGGLQFMGSKARRDKSTVEVSEHAEEVVAPESRVQDDTSWIQQLQEQPSPVSAAEVQNEPEANKKSGGIGLKIATTLRHSAAGEWLFDSDPERKLMKRAGVRLAVSAALAGIAIAGNKYGFYVPSEGHIGMPHGSSADLTAVGEASDAINQNPPSAGPIPDQGHTASSLPPVEVHGGQGNEYTPDPAGSDETPESEPAEITVEVPEYHDNPGTEYDDGTFEGIAREQLVKNGNADPTPIEVRMETLRIAHLNGIDNPYSEEGMLEADDELIVSKS